MTPRTGFDKLGNRGQRRDQPLQRVRRRDCLVGKVKTARTAQRFVAQRFVALRFVAQRFRSRAVRGVEGPRQSPGRVRTVRRWREPRRSHGPPRRGDSPVARQLVGDELD